MAEEKTSAGMSTRKRLAPQVTISDNPSEVYTIRYSPDGRFLAAGCGDGSIRVFNTKTGRLSYNLNVGLSTSLPCTAVRWRPPTAKSKTKNVLLSVNSDGTLQHWHVTSGKCLHSTVEADNQLFCVDFREDGELFATAGKDKVIRIYDEATKTCTAQLSGGLGSSTPGHSNRVFSLKFNPDDPNIIVSGGWDNTVQIWDLRVEHSVRHIYGPHICGDSVDVQGGQVLTGSWRPEDQLELWDLGSGELIERIPWHTSKISGDTPCMLYAAEFSKGEGRGMIAAGGSGSNEARVFDTNHSNALIGTVAGLSRGVFSLDFNPFGTAMAIAGGDAAIRTLEIQDLERAEAKDEGDGAEEETEEGEAKGK